MWEIGKTRADSEKEFDRTVAVRPRHGRGAEGDRPRRRPLHRRARASSPRSAARRSASCSAWARSTTRSTRPSRRSIPALIMGNTVVVKLPRYGVLLPGAAAAGRSRDAFPPGVVNVVNGDGRDGRRARSSRAGEVDVLAFIGSLARRPTCSRSSTRGRTGCAASSASTPRTRPSCSPDADLDLAVRECVTGALSFNGQRCTALKLLFVQRPVAERFLAEARRRGRRAARSACPGSRACRLTPLPEDGQGRGAAAARRRRGREGRARRQRERRAREPDASTSRRSSIPVDARDGALLARSSSARWCPVVPFDDVARGRRRDRRPPTSASRRASSAATRGDVGPLVDALANQVCRVNLNAQCQRGPGRLPLHRAARTPPRRRSRSPTRCAASRSARWWRRPGERREPRAAARHPERPHVELREHRLPVLNASGRPVGAPRA